MITVRYGSGNECSKPDGTYSTISEILRDSALLGFLGASQNVDAVVCGVAVSGDYPVHGGDVISLQTRANTKGN